MRLQGRRIFRRAGVCLIGEPDWLTTGVAKNGRTVVLPTHVRTSRALMRFRVNLHQLSNLSRGTSTGWRNPLNAFCIDFCRKRRLREKAFLLKLSSPFRFYFIFIHFDYFKVFISRVYCFLLSLHCICTVFLPLLLLCIPPLLGLLLSGNSILSCFLSLSLCYDEFCPGLNSG